MSDVSRQMLESSGRPPGDRRVASYCNIDHHHCAAHVAEAVLGKLRDELPGMAAAALAKEMGDLLGVDDFAAAAEREKFRVAWRGLQEFLAMRSGVSRWAWRVVASLVVAALIVIFDHFYRRVP